MTLNWDGFPLAVAKMGCTSPEGKNLWGLKREGLVTSLVSKKRQIGQNPRTTKKQALPKLCKAAKSKFLFRMSQPVKPLYVLFRRNTLIFSATPTHRCWLNWGSWCSPFPQGGGFHCSIGVCLVWVSWCESSVWLPVVWGDDGDTCISSVRDWRDHRPGRDGKGQLSQGLFQGRQGWFFCVLEAFAPCSIFFLHSFNRWSNEPRLDLETTRKKSVLWLMQESLSSLTRLPREAVIIFTW